MSYTEPVSGVFVRPGERRAQARHLRLVPARPRARTETRARVLAALHGATRVGALRDRAWELSVPYSTLRRWVARDPALVARISSERRAKR